MPKIVPKKKRAAVIKKTRAPRKKKEAAEEAEETERPTLRKKRTAPEKTTAADSVEKQILRITKADPREKSETLEQYTLRLAETIDDQDHPEYWEKLDKEGKKWFKEAVKAINDGNPLPALAGVDESESTEAEDDGDEFGEAIAALVEMLLDDVEMDDDTLWKKAKKAKVELDEEAVRGAHPIIVATLAALDEAGRIK